MPQQIINNAESGLAVRTKINANFTELYDLVTNGGSTAFDPKTIPALTLWLDASDSSTLFDSSVGGSNVTTNNSPVTRWKDKSGNDLDAIQTVENSKPILKTAFIDGKNCIRFDGSNDFLTCGVNFNGYSSFTCFMVSKSQGLNMPGVITFGFNVQNSQGTFLASNYENTGAMLGYFGSYIGSPSILPVLTCGVYKNIKLLAILNGQKSSISNNLPSNYTSFIQQFPTEIGVVGTFNSGIKTGFSNADYCEILIYGTELTSIQRQQIELYLNQKWAIF